MLKRLQTDQSLARYAGWFIPLKIETQGEQWAQWASKYRHEGNTIPIVFVVRADGQQLFGKSGSLPGIELPQMLEMSLRQAGAVYNDQQLNLLLTSVEKAKQAHTEGDVEEAVQHIAKIRPLGTLGELGSYAEPATEADAFVKQLTDEGRSLLGEANQQLEQDESVLSGAMALMEARRVYLPLPSLKDEILQAYGEARGRSELKEVLEQAEELDQVKKQLQTDVGKRRALVSLQRILKDYSGQPAGQVAAEWMREYFPELGAESLEESVNVLRQWSSSDGYSVQARLVDFGYTESTKVPYVVLQTAEGKRVEVPFYRLSAESQQAAKEQVRQLKGSTP